MGRWNIETRAWQQVLTHYCNHLRGNDSNQVLRQDIGGGYIRCERCGESYLPEAVPGNPRLLMRILPNEQIEETVPVPTAVVVQRHELVTEPVAPVPTAVVRR